MLATAQMDLGFSGAIRAYSHNVGRRRALVLAASAGIGKATAKVLVEEGARVAICARHPQNLQAAALEIGAELAIPCNLAEPGATEKLVKGVIGQMTGVDILVVNTGGPPPGSFETIATEQWQQGFQLLWLSAVEAIKSVLPIMKSQNWGRVIIITSVAADRPIDGLCISGSLRAGLSTLVRTISKEVGKYGITINAILPGYTKTQRLAELGIRETALKTSIPLNRFAEPHEIGAIAAFLASDLAGYITGQSLVCDGGWSQ